MPRIESDRPIVIAHRGACGYVPEHTLAAYALAIEMGADFIEPDLVMTKDGILVARHENEISGTTDVADRPEFASRETRKTIDGIEVDGWFTEDFTLAELKTLRVKEPIPHLRPHNQRFDGIFQVPSFQEVLALVHGANVRFAIEARAKGEEKRRCVGVYPETKHPTYFGGIGLPMERPLLRLLERELFFPETPTVFIQSFEVTNLKYLRELTEYPLVQLLSDSGAPYDLIASGDPRTYADLATPEGLAEIARYADGIGVNQNLMIPSSAGSLGAPTALIADAHAAGLIVHGWTFRAENVFLPNELKGPGGDAALGDLAGEIGRFLEQGMDGFFTDQADIGVRARDAFVMR
jgi:glycerophosphoryl diester phosphodiesterase